MALELLMADYGYISDYGEEEEEEEESSLLAEAEQQGNMLEIVVYEENTPLEVPEENMLEIVVYEEKSALEEVPEEMTNEIEERKKELFIDDGALHWILQNANNEASPIRR
ncbi:hypothetical protein MKW98_006495 [Papaver atlanticum]|uniref:Uncharacterized protein n=1 Tax=Papaver atlanticum TaxID=357466 RepID=A0AAD4SEZ3_9MAGN|nr:hypothetical protein MKW98_006495 [Papaver atlanticum]